MIKGKPLPAPTDEDVQPPTQAERALLIQRWNENCQPYFVGLLEAQLINEPKPTAKFLYDKRNMTYIHRRTGAKIDREQVKQAFLYYLRKVSQ